MTYAVQYTISALSGNYALKYSVVLHRAEKFEALFKIFDSPLAGFAANAPKREYDPFETFQALMKILKKFKTRGAHPFCNAVIRESDGKKSESFRDKNERGEFTLTAYGSEGLCTQNGRVFPFQTMHAETETYRAEIVSLLEAFKEDLMALLNLCEETISKDAKIIAQTVPNDTPKPAPLIQI